MALDTATKRATAISIGSPWRGILPFPDGAIGQADRLAGLFLYSGMVQENVGQGRIEYTIPRMLLCFTVDSDFLEYRLPKTADEFGVEVP